MTSFFELISMVPAPSACNAHFILVQEATSISRAREKGACIKRKRDIGNRYKK
jgi:hypothetical protein